MLAATLGASLLGYKLGGRGVIKAGEGTNSIFNTISSFNQIWKSKVLSKWT